MQLPQLSTGSTTPTPDPTVREDQEEYDYIGSPEGIAAKIDLARAYRDMQDYQAARKVLAEVVRHGDAGQVEAAQELLNRLEPNDEA